MIRAQLNNKLIIQIAKKPVRSRLHLLLGALVFLLLTSQSVSAKISASVETRLEQGFGRLIFQFDRLPKYTQRVSGTILVVSFDEPVDIDLAPVLKGVAQYVSVARKDPDGRAIRFALTAPFRINALEAGNQLFLDILPKNWVGLPPSLPPDVIARLAKIAQEDAARRAEEEKQLAEARKGYDLKIRQGRYKTFSRVVFDWNKFVVAGMSRDGKTVKVKFSVRADPDMARIKSDPPPFLKAIEKENTRSGMEFTLTVDPRANIRGFREGLSYVVDLAGDEGAIEQSVEKTIKSLTETEEPSAAPQETASEALSLPAETPPSPEKETEQKVDAPSSVAEESQLAARWNESVTVSKEPEPEAGQQSEQTPVPSRRPRDEKDPSEDVQATTHAPPSEVDEDEPPARYADPDNENVDEVPPPQLITAEEETPALREKSQQQAGGSEPPERGEPQELAEIREVSPQQRLQTVTSEKNTNGLKLTFHFENPTPAAIFRRARTLWLIFDTSDEIDISRLAKDHPQVISDVQVNDIESGKKVSIRLNGLSLAAASTRDNDWIIALGENVKDKSKALTPKRKERSGAKSYVSVQLDKAGKVRWLSDPDIGDKLGIVTAHAPARSITKPFRFVDFQALTTAHGLAIKPFADDLSVVKRAQEIVISRAKGLRVSSDSYRANVVPKKVSDKNERPGFIDFDGWQRGGPESFSKELSKLERGIARAEESKRNNLRMELARFFIAHRLAPEVLGTLRLVTDSDPQTEADPRVRILRAVANSFMGRHQEAMKDLDSAVLIKDVDAALWRGMAEISQEKWKNALDSFTAGAAVLPDYPADLQATFRLATANAAIETKLWERVAAELDSLPAANLPRALVAQAELTRGRFFENKLGDKKQAINAYTNAIKEGIAEAEAMAKLHTVSLLYEIKELDKNKAIEELESLSISWRGDNTELRALRLLTQLYADTGQYRLAFQTMKNAIKAFPGEDLALQIQDDTKQIFQEVFLGERAQQLPLTSAIGLFYDFRELTPPGRLGDEMIRRLADRLISVDLLDQASELLDHQVKNRLTGAARAQVAMRLAMVHLMNGKPDLAVRSLRQTRQPNLPSTTQRARDVLEARALGELGRAESAIDLLSRLEGDDIDRLRGDVLWNAQKWGAAGEQFERMMGAKWQDDTDLSKSQRYDVLRAAISYSLAGDTFSLNRLRKKYYNKMVKTEDADAFVLVTQPIKSENSDFDQLVKDIASSSTLDAFMKSFKKRFDDDGQVKQAGRNAPR